MSISNAPFWRNVFLIALAHLALVGGLIRWSLTARASSSPDSIMWLGGAEDLESHKSTTEETPAPDRSSPEPAKRAEPDEKSAPIAPVKSEIELPSATPKPTAAPTATPKPAATPTPKPKVTPKPIARSTPKKTVVAKATPKPATKPKASPAKANAKSGEKEKITLAKKDSAPPGSSGQSGSTGKSGGAGGNTASEFAWYGKMLHDRFYSAWIQPTTRVPTGTKLSTVVRVRIEKDGRVSKFETIKPSKNAVVDESVAAVAKQVTEVDAPPTALSTGDHYDVRINFELNTETKEQ